MGSSSSKNNSFHEGNAIDSAAAAAREVESGAVFKKTVSFRDQLEATARRQKSSIADIAFHQVYFGPNHASNPKIANNRIKTTKYTRLNFLFKNLSEQFKRVANIYFLILALINCVPIVSSFNPLLGFAPIIFVLAVTAAKDLWEDYRRYVSDKETNNRLCQVLRGDTFVSTSWKQLYSGDIIRFHRDEIIPADVILLATSHPQGVCYVETMNLDGETNLKARYVPKLLHKNQEGFDPLLSGKIECDLPNPKIFHFCGCLSTTTISDIPLNALNLLLRGTKLKNTEWVIAVIVYSGPETKAVLNNAGVRFKRSKIEREINGELFLMCAMLFVLSFVGAVSSAAFLEKNLRDSTTYLPSEGQAFSPAVQAILDFWTLVIVFQYVIPISLYVTIEFVKLGQIYFILQDHNLYCPVSDQPIEIKALNIPEDLGQIHYLFCDKTGTLTQNKMEFRKCSIRGRIYQHLDDSSNHHSFDSQLAAEIQKCELSDPDLFHFILCMAVCNTCVPSSLHGTGHFDAESPDESSLVKTAYMYGFKLVERSLDELVVEILGKRMRYRISFLLPFDSSRKRMSLLIQNESGQYTLFCKGAECAIHEVLAKNESNDSSVSTQTMNHLSEFSHSGLRTLVLSKRNVTSSEAAQMEQNFQQISTMIDSQADIMDAFINEVEKDLSLLGCTGIEDKLQEGVPDSIAKLRAAGIKIWILTGDNQETAVNIARDCKLFSDDIELLYLVAESRRDFSSQLEHLYQKVCIENDGSHQYGLIINGATVAYALEEKSQSLFADLACSCISALVCRATPSQKARIVKLVKDQKNMMTMAVGDGANDVSMIQTANIGIGISGQEGMQAKMASDFAIPQFRFLVRLILVHGHWSYDRLSYMLLFFFFKNFCMVLVNFWFQIYCAFSAQSIFDPVFLQTYNVFWSSLPPLIMGIMDQNISDRTLMAHPELYRISRYGKIFTMKRFWLFLLHSVYQSVIIFFSVYALYVNSTMDLYQMGQTLNFIVIICVNLSIGIEFRRWNWLVHFSIWGTILVFVGYQLGYNSIPAVDYYWAFETALSCAQTWFLVFIVVVLAMGPSIVYKFIRHFYFPHEFDLLREQEKIGVRERRAMRKLHSLRSATSKAQLLGSL